MYWTCYSINNLSSYCGLVDAKIRASDKDLPVQVLFGPGAFCQFIFWWIHYYSSYFHRKGNCQNAPLCNGVKSFWRSILIFVYQFFNKIFIQHAFIVFQCSIRIEAISRGNGCVWKQNAPSERLLPQCVCGLDSKAKALIG